MTSLSLDGIGTIASLIRAEKPNLQSPHASYWSSAVLGDWMSQDLESAFEDWMYSWATEVSYGTSLAMHVASECEAVVAALATLDQQAGAILNAQFD